jgi:hypothetical protein
VTNFLFLACQLLNGPLENSERALSQLFFFGLKLLSVNQGAPATVESKSFSVPRKLCESVSTILWPTVGRTIMESKHLIGGKHEVCWFNRICLTFIFVFFKALLGRQH